MAETSRRGRRGIRAHKRHGLLPTQPVASCTPAFDDPQYLGRVAGIASLSVLMVGVSAAVLLVLMTVEALLWTSKVPVLRVAGAAMAILHASFLVNTAAQAKRSLVDFWRCGSGKEPKSYTVERIMQVIETDREEPNEPFDWFMRLFVLSSPFTPLAVFALCEIFALQSPAVWERIADARAAAHHMERCKRPAEMLRTSRQVVVAKARTGVLATV